MTQAAVKISDAIEEEWLRTYKVIDLLGVVLSLQAIFKFWFVRQPLGNIYFASLIMSLVALIVDFHANLTPVFHSILTPPVAV